MSPRSPLPDIIAPDLSLLFVGINPGLRSAALGHHFAGHGNRFWKLLHGSGLVPEPLGFEDDRRLIEFGYGLTNIVDRPTRSADELSKADYARGRSRLEKKILRYRPRWIAFVGVTVYRVYFRELGGAVELGPAGARIGASRVFVLPNPSGRNAHYPIPRMLEAYRALGAALSGRAR